MTSRTRSVLLMLVTLSAGLVAPAGVAATTSPTQIALDQATASTVAELWFPIVRDLDVPPSCGATNPIECPGGVQRTPSTNLRLTRVSLEALPYQPSTFFIGADLRVETLDPIAVTVSGVECSLTIDTAAGTSPSISVATQANLQSSLLLDYNFLVQGDTVVFGLEPDDVTFGGNFFCVALNFGVSLSIDLLEEQLAEVIRSGGPLCGAPAPDLVVTCPWFSVVPSSADFGDQAVGSSSAAQLITITNAGSGYPYVFDIGQVSIEGADAGDFGIGADGCSNTTLWSGICTLEVTFAPSASGARSAQLTVPNNWVEGPATVMLTGNGLGAAPEASVSPTSLSFGTVAVGATSATQAVMITNTGDPGQALAFSSAQIIGTNAADFAMASDGCVSNGFLAAGASCQIEVTFTPSAAGARSATLSIADNAGDSPQTIALTGAGETPSADLSVGITGAAGSGKAKGRITYTITVYNAGPATALDVQLNDLLSSQTTFVLVSSSGGSCVAPPSGATGVVSCSLGSFASGASSPVQIVVSVVAKKALITNTITVTTSTYDPNLANNTASITTQVK